MDDFTVTFTGSEGCSNIHINHAIDFETHAYEVCMTNHNPTQLLE